MFSNKIIIILLSVFLLAGAVFLGVLSWRNIIQKQQPQVNQINVEADLGHLTEPRETNITGMPMTSIEEAKKDGEIEWLAAPVKLGDLKLVEYAEDSAGMSSIEYYKVASMDKGEEIINEFIQPQSPAGKQVIRFKKTADGKYFLINKNSEFEGNDFKSNVAIDKETNIESLDAPAKLLVNGMNFNKKDWFNKMPLEWNTLIKIASTENGDFFKKLTADDYNLSYVEYVLKMPDTTAVYYDMPFDFLAGDNSLIVNLNADSQIFKDKKFNAALSKGCSLAAPIISNSDLADRIYQIGTTKSGNPLYAPKDTSDDLFKAVYDVYKIGRDGTTDFDGNPVLTFEEFAAKKPVIVWRDALGDYHVFYDSEYSALAECGKPVIYLYPEIETDVKVQVGAKVRISEPDYGEGWKVTANSDGKIINSDGAEYGNLYWEGLGHGDYPAITEGRIVKGENIEVELKHDLAALGLNKKESADFMEFWLDKMPKTPYIRLTWLDTAEMNELAPLAIQPRPDTVKRIFLDFAGQNTTETKLAPQKLNGFARTGFTVVEWGGLLIGNR